jgi:hypothetical protein
MMLLSAILISTFISPVGASRLSRADEPPVVESLPSPQVIITESAPVRTFDLPVMLPYERVDRYAVWQYVAPDRMGRFRPRVIYSPQGAYYLFNGAPFLYTATHTLNFMSYATD